MKTRSFEVKDNGTGLMLCAGSWNHPLSHEEGQQLKETLRKLLNQPVGYDTFEILLPEDGGTESVIIDRGNAFALFVDLKKMFNK